MVYGYLVPGVIYTYDQRLIYKTLRTLGFRDAGKSVAIDVFDMRLEAKKIITDAIVSISVKPKFKRPVIKFEME